MTGVGWIDGSHGTGGYGGDGRDRYWIGGV